MYVEGQRIRPRTYRFDLPAKVEHEDVLFIMSGVHAALTPRDYTKTSIGSVVDIELAKDVPSAGGAISVYAFFSTPQTPRKSRGQPQRK